jgi:hypothetical protein
MHVLLVIVAVAAVIVLNIFTNEHYEKKIDNQISAMGGRVIHIEKKVFGTGPFVLCGKGRTIYRIEYEIEDEIREGWVRFGSLFGPDWRL